MKHVVMLVGIELNYQSNACILIPPSSFVDVVVVCRSWSLREADMLS